MSLRELQDKKRQKPKRLWDEKRCRFCLHDFTPRSGMAAKHRTHCYDPECEEAAERDRRRVLTRAQDGRGGSP